ncbi:hypothetical protein A0H81_13679 [Grifola frondosa]|uniref:J domain-containing protein n=1 Tax=Grifola frondosa TaxID=5627 RepID=A0A1C7LNL3_GRIFR|nr:hypothetical protein A0H81_13679 [Grifola frondosa]
MSLQSSYYKLSKLYHPDLTKDPKTKDKFQAVSDAYAVLGDDRRRRAYDRSLAEASMARHPYAPPHEASHASAWSYETRKRGATYAWEYSRRPNTAHHAPHRHPPPPPPPGSSHYANQSSDHPHRQHPGHPPPRDPFDPWHRHTLDGIR